MSELNRIFSLSYEVRERIRDHCTRKRYLPSVIEGGIEVILHDWALLSRLLVKRKIRTFDEYLAKTDSRRRIAEILPMIDDQSRADVEAEVVAIDRVFLHETVECPECIWGPCNAEEYGYSPVTHWWYYRLPRSEFAEWRERYVIPLATHDNEPTERASPPPGQE